MILLEQGPEAVSFLYSKEILRSLEISSDIPIGALLPQHLIFF